MYLTMIFVLLATFHNVTLTIPGALPRNDDDHLCSAFQVKDWFEKENVFINRFVVKDSYKHAHHMLLYACSSPLSGQGTIW